MSLPRNLSLTPILRPAQTLMTLEMLFTIPLSVFTPQKLKDSDPQFVR